MAMFSGCIVLDGSAEMDKGESGKAVGIRTSRQMTHMLCFSSNASTPVALAFLSSHLHAMELKMTESQDLQRTSSLLNHFQ